MGIGIDFVTSSLFINKDREMTSVLKKYKQEHSVLEQFNRIKKLKKNCSGFVFHSRFLICGQKGYILGRMYGSGNRFYNSNDIKENRPPTSMDGSQSSLALTNSQTPVKVIEVLLKQTPDITDLRTLNSVPTSQVYCFYCP